MLIFFIEDRPGVLLMDPDEEDRDLLEEFCYDFGFYRTFEKADKDDRGKLETGGYFIAREEERLAELVNSKGEFYGLSDKVVGRFLGIPDREVKYFSSKIKKGHVEAPTREKLRAILGDEIPFEDARYIEVTPYVPIPDRESIGKAIKKGKKIEADIIEFDRVYDFHTGKTILSHVLQNQMYV